MHGMDVGWLVGVCGSDWGSYVDRTYTCVRNEKTLHTSSHTTDMLLIPSKSSVKRLSGCYIPKRAYLRSRAKS